MCALLSVSSLLLNSLECTIFPYVSATRRWHSSSWVINRAERVNLYKPFSFFLFRCYSLNIKAFITDMRTMLSLRILTLFWVTLSPLAWSSVIFSSNFSTKCRCMQNDDCWPTTEEWTNFNASLGGKLIATVPLASSCHYPSYNASSCQYLKNHWTEPELQ